MNYSFFFFSIFLFMFHGYAQDQKEKDIRAKLKFGGRSDEISVSPAEQVWLVTARGEAYYTDHINSTWHKCSNFSDNGTKGGRQLERISFFNKVAAIMTGYIDGENDKKNGLYVTTDQGQHWKLVNFGGDDWIYDAYTDEDGNAWIGGSSGDIYFSGDFGQHWQKLNSPFGALRMNRIFMLNLNEGIAGALNNAIYTTKDNWKTSQKIQTPYDQKKCATTADDFNNRIKKIVIWNNYVFINEKNNFFYTDKNKIDWKPLPVSILDFAFEKKSNKLLAITPDLKVISFSTPLTYSVLNDKPLEKTPGNIKVVNSSLYALDKDQHVYKVNALEHIRITPYTTDYKIEKPLIIREALSITWGFDENELYLSEKGKSWYRENALDFDVEECRLLGDSTAILWDGKENYVYALKDHKATRYTYDHPLQDFLKYPLTSFKIKAGSSGCYHSMSNEIEYLKSEDSVFTTNGVYAAGSEKKGQKSFKNKINEQDVLKVMHSLNSNPAYVSTLADFEITKEDSKNYLKLVNNRLDPDNGDGYYTINADDKKFYYTIPEKLDSVDNTIIAAALSGREKGWSTTSNSFRLQFFNQHQDTLSFEVHFHSEANPWHLPWHMQYKGQHLSYYNVALSKLVDACIPKEFMQKEVFDNKLLILKIGDYLNWKKNSR